MKFFEDLTNNPHIKIISLILGVGLIFTSGVFFFSSIMGIMAMGYLVETVGPFEPPADAIVPFLPIIMVVKWFTETFICLVMGVHLIGFSFREGEK